MVSNQNSLGGDAAEKKKKKKKKKSQESQDIMSSEILARKIQKRLLEDLSPQRDPKVQEIHAI